jgi:hypothetical protein
VAIYQFNSGLPDVPGPSVRDLFVTALVQTGRFVVMPPSTQPGVPTQAEMILDGVINEANLANVKVKPELNDLLKGLLTGDVRPLTLDIRITDARTGAMLDMMSINAKELRNTKVNLADWATMLGNDKAKRDALTQRLMPYINEAVNRIVARYAPQPVAAPPATFQPGMPGALVPGQPGYVDPYQQQQQQQQQYGATSAYGTPSPYGATTTQQPYGQAYGQTGTQAYGQTPQPYGQTGYPQTGYPSTTPSTTNPYGTTQPGTAPYGQTGYPPTGTTTDPYAQSGYSTGQQAYGQAGTQPYGQTGYPQTGYPATTPSAANPYGTTTQPGATPYGQTGYPATTPSTTSPYGTTQPGTAPYGQTGYPPTGTTTDPYAQSGYSTGQQAYGQAGTQPYGQTGYPATTPSTNPYGTTTQPGTAPYGQTGYPATGAPGAQPGAPAYGQTGYPATQGTPQAGTPYGSTTPYYGQLQPGQVAPRGIEGNAGVPELTATRLMVGFDPEKHAVADVREKVTPSLGDGSALIDTAPSGHKLFANIRNSQVESWVAKDDQGADVPLNLLNNEPDCWECALNPGLCWKVTCPLESHSDDRKLEK